MASNKHLLTGTNLTGYSCSLCKQSWDAKFTLEEIEQSPCEPHEKGHLRHHARMDMSRLELPQPPQCPPYLETPQERKGRILIDQWEKEMGE